MNSKILLWSYGIIDLQWNCLISGLNCIPNKSDNGSLKVATYVIVKCCITVVDSTGHELLLATSIFMIDDTTVIM